jgi:hypothetical protein
MVGGLACAIACGRYLEHLIVGVEPLELLSSSTAALFLLVTALVAAWKRDGPHSYRRPRADALRAE